jgi:hypothetical protein
LLSIVAVKMNLRRGRNQEVKQSLREYSNQLPSLLDSTFNLFRNALPKMLLDINVSHPYSEPASSHSNPLKRC